MTFYFFINFCLFDCKNKPTIVNRFLNRLKRYVKGIDMFVISSFLCFPPFGLRINYSFFWIFNRSNIWLEVAPIHHNVYHFLLIIVSLYNHQPSTTCVQLNALYDWCRTFLFFSLSPKNQKFNIFLFFNKISIFMHESDWNYRNYAAKKMNWSNNKFYNNKLPYSWNSKKKS